MMKYVQFLHVVFILQLLLISNTSIAQATATITGGGYSAARNPEIPKSRNPEILKS